MRHARVQLRTERLECGLAVGEVREAGLGGQREAGGYRDAQPRHLEQPRALAAETRDGVLDREVLPCPEGVDAHAVLGLVAERASYRMYRIGSIDGWST